MAFDGFDGFIGTKSGGVVDVLDLCGGYDDKSSGFVLKGLSISIPKGSVTAIVGPNGSGKSTLLKHLIRELRPKHGSVVLLGNDIYRMQQRDIARLIGFEGQSPKCNGSFSVSEVVSMGRFAYGDENSCSGRVHAALEKVGILHLSDKDANRLSGGEFQLVMLARAICQDTPILALDEPANNLDPVHQKRLMDLLVELANDGRTVVCVLHDINAALRYCTHCAMMKDGRLHSFGRTTDVITVDSIKAVYGIDSRFIDDPVSDCRFLLF